MSELTQSDLRDVLSYDAETGEFVWRKSRGRQRAGSVAGCIAPVGYRLIGVGGKLYWAHRLAWLWVHGAMPAGTIDHIDGNPLNNRLVNLRDVPQATNNQNIRKTFRAAQEGMPRGVWQVGPRSFRAQISVEDKTRYLGTYRTPAAASARYEAARAELHAGYVEAAQ